MRTWLVRGATLAVVHAAATTFVAWLTASDPTGRSLTQALVLGVLVAAAAVWAAVDAWRDLPDRGMVWLAAALVAGVGSAVLGVIGRATLVDQTGTGELAEALSGGAAFTALLILVPAGLGLLIGRSLSNRPDEDAEEAEAPPRSA